MRRDSGAVSLGREARRQLADVGDLLERLYRFGKIDRPAMRQHAPYASDEFLAQALARQGRVGGAAERLVGARREDATVPHGDLHLAAEVVVRRELGGGVGRDGDL